MAVIDDEPRDDEGDDAARRKRDADIERSRARTAKGS